MTRCVSLLVLLFSVSVGAQQPPAPKAPAAPNPPQPAAVPNPPQPPAPPAPEPVGQPINIRLDVSVIDQSDTGASQPKTLMVMLRDSAMGRTRAAFEDRSISADARPTIVNGRIRVDITVASDPSRPGDPAKFDPTLRWHNAFSLLLENGKPLIALETTDAVTKRKMSIEVKATIQK
jgi:hypothetical protein